MIEQGGFEVESSWRDGAQAGRASGAYTKDDEIQTVERGLDLTLYSHSGEVTVCRSNRMAVDSLLEVRFLFRNSASDLMSDYTFPVHSGLRATCS